MKDKIQRQLPQYADRVQQVFQNALPIKSTQDFKAWLSSSNIN